MHADERKVERGNEVQPESHDGRMRILQTKVLLGAAGVLGLVTVVFIIISAAKTNPTSGESLMLGTLISIFSVIATILVSHFYYNLSSQSASEDAKRSYDEKIRTFARKAAEKVFNLSNEFARLAENLKAAVEDSEEEETNKITILVLREKMHSAIHILETLKSMNDTSLSDWRGIIGEDLQLQRQLELQINDELEEQRELIEKLQARVDVEALEPLEERLKQVESRLSEKILALPFAFRPLKTRQKKEEVQIICPGCNVENTVKIRARAGALKLFPCIGCKHFVVVKYLNEKEKSTEMAAEVTLEVGCGVCKAALRYLMPEVTGAQVNVVCENCGAAVNAVNTKEGIKYQGFRVVELNGKFLELVLANVPPKPWPQGMSKDIAKKLGVSNSTIDKAIGGLIKAGRLEPSYPAGIHTEFNDPLASGPSPT